VIRSISPLICIFLGITFSVSTQAQATDLTKNFGIGLQGATTAFGGISFRYNGLAPVYLQTAGRFILNDQDRDHMLGAGVSYAIFEHQSQWNIARLYFTLEGGWRHKKEQELRQEIGKTTTLGVGLAFGGELVFSLGGIPLGLNVEIGQGFGREKSRSQSKDLAGVYVGTGIHAYF
jgi:hypothetical protein